MIILQELEQAQWRQITVDHNGQVNVTRLPNLADATAERNQRIVVLLSGEQVLVTRIHMPKASRAEMEKAVPFALEEQLAEDIDQLVFAIGDYDQTEKLLVAVVNKTVLNETINNLAQAGIYPDLILPDFLALSIPNAGASILVDEQKARFHFYDDTGFVIETELIDTVLNLNAEPFSLLNELDLYERNSSNNILALPENIHVNKKQVNFADVLDISRLQKSSINLLPKKFRKKKQSFRLKNGWKAAVISAITMVMVLFGGKGLQFYLLQHQVNQLHQEIAGMFQTTFPKSTEMVAPRRQMSHTLTELRHSLQGDQFLFLLAKVGKVLSQYADIQLLKIHFQSTELIIQVAAPHLATLQRFSDELVRQELSVKQNELNTDRQKSIAEFQIGELANA